MSQSSRVHIFGASSPLSRYLCSNLLLHTPSITLYNYSRSPGFLPYESFSSNFQPYDLIVSLIPIETLYSFLTVLLSENLSPSRIICLSSSSIYSKLYSRCSDSSRFLHFAIGELLLHDFVQSLPIKPDLLILRPTMLWGDCADKNINFMYRFVCRYGFFPVSSSATGHRAPLHFSQLSDIICDCIFWNKAISGTFFVHGDEKIEFRDLLKLIISFVPSSSTPFLLSIDGRFLRMLSRFFSAPPFEEIGYFFSSISRQASDLSDFAQANRLPFETQYRLTFKQLLYKTYSRETLENSGLPRDNGAIIAGQG